MKLTHAITQPAVMQPALILISAFTGIALGFIPGIENPAEALVEPFLMAMLLFVFLSLDIGRVGAALKNPRFTLTALGINFVWTPAFAMFLARTFLPGSIDAQIGLVMMLVAPCTDWYLVYTRLAHGDVEASAALLPFNLVLQIALLPLYLWLFVGSGVSYDPVLLLQSMLLVLAIPLACAVVIRFIASRINKRDQFHAFIECRSDNFQLLFLCLAVLAMFAAEGKQVAENPQLLLLVFIPLALFFGVTLLIDLGVGKALHLARPQTVSLAFTTLARNSPLSLAIAVGAFPSQPLVALTLVIGPLVELPVLTLISFGFRKHER